MPSSCTSCEAVCMQTHHLCLSMRDNPQRLYPCLSHPHYAWDDSELEEAGSSVLFRLPATVPPTKPMVAPEGLGGLTGSHPPSSELGLGPVCGTNSSVSWLTLRRAGFNPYLNFLESRHGSSWCDEWSSELLGEWSHFPCEGTARKSEKGCTLSRECLPRGCLVGKTLVEVKSLVEELDHQKGHGAQ